MATAAERQRRYRERHPDRSKADLATLRTKPRRRTGKQSVVRSDGKRSDVTLSPKTMQSDGGQVGHGEPQAAARDPHAKLLALEAALESNLAYLRALAPTPQIARSPAASTTRAPGSLAFRSA
jgi:hypothetical protein